MNRGFNVNKGIVSGVFDGVYNVRNYVSNLFLVAIYHQYLRVFKTYGVSWSGEL